MKLGNEGIPLAIITHDQMLRMLELDSVVFSEKRMITRKSTFDYINSTDETIKQRSA
ncbi:MAG: hypothetical protein M3299_09060 [Thermoproteota archaeon]|nr:hypothetical protein [Thermoproteota archaeon]